MSIIDQVSNPDFQSTLADYSSPRIGTPSASSLDSSDGGSGGGILGSLLSPGTIQGLSNVGLQWFTATTKGVATPLVVPQPVQATPAAATANVINQLTGYLPLIILVIALVVIISLFKKSG